jgi:hypothetical protein
VSGKQIGCTATLVIENTVSTQFLFLIVDSVVLYRIASHGKKIQVVSG